MGQASYPRIAIRTYLGFSISLAALFGPTNLAFGQATSTPTPTPTRTPTPTFTASPDNLEPNETSATARLLSVGATNAGLNLYPAGDVDWFAFDAKGGKRYSIDLVPEIGLDSFMELYSGPTGEPVASNDDKALGDLGSTITYTVGSAGTYYIKIVNLDRTNPAHKDYTLSILEVSADPTPTIIPGTADPYEPNYDFSHASLIGSDSLVSANFVPWAGSDPNAPDNDFYRIYVKTGLTVTCYTFNLGPSTDTNLILYDSAGNVLGGNDDVQIGDLTSRVSARVGVSAYLYALVGQGHDVSPSDTPNLTYSLTCTVGIPTPIPPPATATPAPASGPQAPMPTALPTPSPTPTPTFFGVFAVSTPVRPTQNVPAVADFDVQVIYDANGNHAADADEGIQGMIVELRDRALGVLLARTVTDELGRVRLTGTAFGEFDLRVPYLGLRRALRASEQNVSIEIRGSALPLLIP